MTRDEIIGMAREAAAKHGHTLKDEPSTETVEFIVELVAMAAAKERDACAALCRERYAARVEGGFPREASSARACENDIRARGQ